MLTRVNSPSNTSNIENRLITEPSVYLQQLQKLLADKQKTLSKTAVEMQKSVDELETNVNLMKQRLSTLENARKRLEEELIKNSEQLKRAPDPSKLEELQNKNRQLNEEKLKIDQEMSQKLTQINKLEKSLEEKEREWNNNKKELMQRLKQFESQELIPYLNQIENIMQLTNSKIQASNTKLTKFMTGEMDFGISDPFDSIGQKFKEKLVNRQDLFNENNFGKATYGDGDEDGGEDGEEDGGEDGEEYLNIKQSDMNFGMEEDFEVEEIDEINDTDSDDEDIELDSDLDEESSESSNED